jgi:cobalt/nickel transport system permease protein
VLFIDQYAYINKLNKVHPGEKILFSVLTMCIAMASKSIAIHTIVFILMAIATLFLAGIPKKIYINLLMLPLSFIILGVLPILILISDSNVGFNLSIKVLNFYFGITNQGMYNALIIIFRSMAAAACLYFVTLTTTLIDILEMLRKAKLSQTIIEIMSLIYRFIFVLIDASFIIYHSQSARLGYSSISTSFRSLGKLVSMVFIKAYNNSQALYISLISRGYCGELHVISNEYTMNKANITVIILIELTLIGLSFILGG